MTEDASSARVDGRQAQEMRPIVIKSAVNPYAEGSCQVAFGNTVVLCTASIEAEQPRWMDTPGHGWITAEYGMLPRSTHTRMKREASIGKQGGRTLEIQRLIGRALRRAVNLAELGEITIRVDCDVLCADGGTRTAAISGGWVALHSALSVAVSQGALPKLPEILPIAAVSLGKVDGQYLLDLCYEEDSQAEFDMNIVCDSALDIIEIQGSAEQGTINLSELNSLMKLAHQGLKQIFVCQEQAVNG